MASDENEAIRERLKKKRFLAALKAGEGRVWAKARNGTLNLRIGTITKIGRRWDEGDTVQVSNEYSEEEPRGCGEGAPLQDGDIILMEESAVEAVVVEACDSTSENYAPVITYGTGDEDPYAQVEVDQSYFNSYEQYYDESDDLVYESSDCGTSIGIRG